MEREIYNIPVHIPVIILANHRDMGQHRTVDVDTMRYFVSSLDRLVLIRCAELAFRCNKGFYSFRLAQV